MRIVALADIHYPGGGRRRLERLVAAAAGAAPDVLVIAGDLPTLGNDYIDEVMAAFGALDCPRLFVAGNHDVWTEGGAWTREQYEQTLAQLCRDNGFHYLDRGPKRIGDIGFAGCLGWYDYSLRQTEEPVADVVVTPAHPSHRSVFAHIEPLAGRERLRWEQLEERDYVGKALIWEEDDRTHTLVWNDVIYADWGMPDRRVVDEQVFRLRRSVERLGDVGGLVAVTHTVPFVEAFTRPYRRVDFAFCRAYMGSARLGAALRDDPRLRVWICGHVHYQVTVECQGVTVVNVSCAPEQKGAGPTVIELDERDLKIERVPVR